MKRTAFTPPPVPAQEEQRLKELHDLKLLDDATELRFDRYANLVADIFDFPIVLVTLMDRDRQWFRSSVGWHLRDAPRELSFCNDTIKQDEVMVVADALADPRFAENPLVVDSPNIRFYAGTAVHGPGGNALGTLCILDHKPRELGERERRRLRQFADLIENEIQHVRNLQLLSTSMESSAYYDPLTRLPNRRLLMDRLAKLLELAALEQHQVSVLLFNIIGLRLINQSLGTKGGDALLRQVGQRLNDCCPTGGSVARLQADEFILAFPLLKQEAAYLEVVTDNVRAALDKPFAFGGHEHYLRVQIGGSLFPEQGATPEALVEQASAAIHFVSGNQPGTVRYFTRAESKYLSRRLRIESGLRGALEKNEFHLLYQPIVSLANGKLAGVEALLRWQTGELGNIPPDQFIPIAEQTGQIVAIGRWVQAEACRQIQEWRQNLDWDVPVAINAAAAELAQPHFALNLIRQLEDAAIPGWMLSVEVTEFSLVSDSPMVIENLTMLRDFGVRVNIDDFGTGYSSLSYLRHLPVSTLKIDRSFIEGLPGSTDGGALTCTIINMAQALGLGQVAEGIETLEQLDFLRHNHCEFGQGYLISHPIPPHQIPALRGGCLV